jgi:hypothetical protein
MASAAQPVPNQDPNQGGGAPAPTDPSAQQSPSMGAPADPTQIMLAQMYQLCKQLAQANPIMAEGLSEAANGIQKAQSAQYTSPQPTPTGANPPY